MRETFEVVRAVVASNTLRLIEARRMSFADASRLTGISKTGLYKIADGTSDPCLSSLCKIAGAFGVPLSTLLIDASTPDTPPRETTDEH